MRQKGFTLIELLVVISIIGLLASVVLVSLNGARKKARDIARKSTLRQIASALELYFSNYNTYPTTPNGIGGFTWYSSENNINSSYCTPLGSCPGFSASGNFIPGLAPAYISQEPHDPNPSIGLVCAGWAPSYIYNSNGTDYKIVSHCAAETGYQSEDSFYDPVRPTWAWQVSTPGAISW